MRGGVSNSYNQSSRLLDLSGHTSLYYKIQEDYRLIGKLHHKQSEFLHSQKKYLKFI